jgi:hypothetical protein
MAAVGRHGDFEELMSRAHRRARVKGQKGKNRNDYMSARPQAPESEQLSHAVSIRLPSFAVHEV